MSGMCLSLTHGITKIVAFSPGWKGEKAVENRLDIHQLFSALSGAIWLARQAGNQLAASVDCGAQVRAHYEFLQRYSRLGSSRGGFKAWHGSSRCTLALYQAKTMPKRGFKINLLIHNK